MLQELEGVETARIDGMNDRATVIYDARIVGVDAMLEAVEGAGFEASVATAPATPSG